MGGLLLTTLKMSNGSKTSALYCLREEGKTGRGLSAAAVDSVLVAVDAGAASTTSGTTIERVDDSSTGAGLIGNSTLAGLISVVVSFLASSLVLSRFCSASGLLIATAASVVSAVSATGTG